MLKAFIVVVVHLQFVLAVRSLLSVVLFKAIALDVFRCAQLAQQFIKRRACSFRSAGNILIDSLAAGRLERIHLQAEILASRTYARVPEAGAGGELQPLRNAMEA